MLYVVQNGLNRISVFGLDAKVGTATPRRTITDPRFDVLATAARVHRCRRVDLR
ncbi:hypothetical protein [Streptomyces sp. NPDC101455]|uniref:hypothetical protein n=1 Tax=Streptomyces sp. NPDC101455 TaxID=3366142 RepID=UPI0038047355